MTEVIVEQPRLHRVCLKEAKGSLMIKTFLNSGGVWLLLILVELVGGGSVINGAYPV